ncbi:MAG TPA: hypothetical protein VG866_00125 [Candidatus Paceibacterota bacterium]|nr:hypothetical protein [Candidatus Paceibacterota bacterium]
MVAWLLIGVGGAYGQEIKLDAGIVSAPSLGYWPPAPILQTRFTWNTGQLRIRQLISLDIAHKTETRRGWTASHRGWLEFSDRSFAPLAGAAYTHLNGGPWHKDTLWWLAGGVIRGRQFEFMIDYRAEITSSTANRVQTIDLPLTIRRGRWSFGGSYAIERALKTPGSGPYWGIAGTVTAGWYLTTPTRDR